MTSQCHLVSISLNQLMKLVLASPLQSHLVLASPLQFGIEFARKGEARTQLAPEHAEENWMEIGNSFWNRVCPRYILSFQMTINPKKLARKAQSSWAKVL